MKYISTRGEAPPVSFSEAVATGLAPDAGLYLPETLPSIADKLEAWDRLGYADLCFEFLRLFATDIPEDTLRSICTRAYESFDDPTIAPLKSLSKNLHVLELFHGPTLAFKDFALQVLGNLYEEQVRRTGQPITVLGATSGDTGSAAIHGLLGREGMTIFILYPDGRISPLQERQMACTGAPNVFPIAIRGTFDDGQHALKEIFADQGFRKKHGLSAINSINLARILAQCVYYIHGWLRLPKAQRKDCTFVVPTGNFGNIFAGYLACKMGLPIAGLKVATNQNDILHRFFSTGDYSLGDVKPSHAPSMDIQVASNFERFLWFHEDGDSARVREVMRTFKETGSVKFDHFESGIFSSSRTDDGEILGIIRDVHHKYGYTADPHTACGFKDLDDSLPHVILSTAHPAKFPNTVIKATCEEPISQTLEALKAKELVKYPLEASVEAICNFIEDRV
jgi:threonine synthase